MRLIDANPLWDFFRDQQNEITKYSRYHQLNDEDAAAYDRLETVLDAIDKAPTIEPDGLVKRGKWEIVRSPYGKIEGWLCPCGRTSQEKSKYCPNCGAKMEEE